MGRALARPLVRDEVGRAEAIAFIAVTGAAGLAILLLGVNALTMWLTAATFLGYAVIYTLVLKPLTPQNIVIGGASGAMPPVLGWAAATGTVSPEALLLFLIVFVWTPPRCWSTITCNYRKARPRFCKMARRAPPTMGSHIARRQP